MQLTINNIVIPLDPGASLPLVLRSPLFLTDKGNIPGSYIFNFNIPAGEAIRSVFGQAHRVQRHDRATSELPYKITDGIMRFVGKCIVTQASEDVYEISCKIDNGDLAAKLYSKTLKELNLGGNRDIAAMYSTAVITNDTINEYNGSVEFTLDALRSLHVLSDFTNSMSDNGATFTAPFNMDCTLKLFLENTISRPAGTLRVLVSKNGLLFIDIDEAQVGVQIHDITEELSLLDGDVISVELRLYSVYIPENEGNSIYVIIDGFRIEYSAGTNISVIPTLDQYGSDYALFPLHNKELLSNFPDDAFQLDNLSIKTIYSIYSPVINYYKAGDFPLYLTGIIEGETVFCANLITPFVYMRTILIAIAESAGFNIVNNPFEAEFTNMVLFNAFIENIYSPGNVSLLPAKTSFNLVDHVPDMTQSDFLKHVSLLTGYMFIIDNNALTITFVDLKNKQIISESNPVITFPCILLSTPLVTIDPEYKGIKFELKKAGNDKYQGMIKELNDKLNFVDQVTNLADLPATGNQVNDMYLVASLNDFYVFQYNPKTYILDWVFYSKNFTITFTQGEGPFLSIASDFSPVLTAGITDTTIGAPENRKWTIPVTEQPGIFEGFPDSLSTKVGLQVLYYKGMVNDSLAAPYPLGSSRMADYASNPDGSPDLSADGIFNSRYKSWLQWLAYETKPVTYKAILTRAQLKKIKFDQVYCGTGFNFLVKEVRVNLGFDGPSIAEIDIYTV